MAFNVATAFEQFCKNLRFSDENLTTIGHRYHAITKRINTDYWNSSSDTTHSLYVGSFGRDTEIHTSDIDMLVQLPYETYKKFDAYTSNGQSALLQEVKKVIEKTYSVTKLKQMVRLLASHLQMVSTLKCFPLLLTRTVVAIPLPTLIMVVLGKLPTPKLKSLPFKQ